MICLFFLILGLAVWLVHLNASWGSLVPLLNFDRTQDGSRTVKS